MAKSIKFNKVSIFLFIISFLVINSQDSKNNNDTLVLNIHYEDNKIYTIEERDGIFGIITKIVVICVKAPCPPIYVKKNIENEEDCKNLKILFDSIFKNSNIKEKTVYYGELTEEQIQIILNVLDNNKIISVLKYEILDNNEKYNIKYKERGYSYEIDEENEEGEESVIYTIAMGEKPSGGYSIEIQKIKIKGNKVSIYISEKVPGKDEVVTAALTYPIIQIKFNHLPSFVEVINYETGDIFPNLK